MACFSDLSSLRKFLKRFLQACVYNGLYRCSLFMLTKLWLLPCILQFMCFRVYWIGKTSRMSRRMDHKEVMKFDKQCGGPEMTYVLRKNRADCVVKMRSIWLGCRSSTLLSLSNLADLLNLARCIKVHSVSDCSVRQFGACRTYPD